MLPASVWFDVEAFRASHIEDLPQNGIRQSQRIGRLLFGGARGDRLVRGSHLWTTYSATRVAGADTFISDTGILAETFDHSLSQLEGCLPCICGYV